MYIQFVYRTAGGKYRILRSLVKESGTLAGQIALVEDIGQTAVGYSFFAYLFRVFGVLDADAFRKVIHIVVCFVICLQYEGGGNCRCRFALDLTRTETVSDLRSRVVCTAVRVCRLIADPQTGDAGCTAVGFFRRHIAGVIAQGDRQSAVCRAAAGCIADIAVRGTDQAAGAVIIRLCRICGRGFIGDIAAVHRKAQFAFTRAEPRV